MLDLRATFGEALLPHVSTRAFAPHERICEQGEYADALHVLVAGKIKVYNATPEGATHLLAFMTPIEAIGDIEFVREMACINTVEAVTACEALRVPYHALKAHGTGHAPLLMFLLEQVTRKLTLSTRATSFNLLHPVEVRLASYLLSVAGAEGAIAPQPLGDTANLIGTSYRHLTRVLRELREAGLVARDAGGLRVVDRAGLRAIAGSNVYEEEL